MSTKLLIPREEYLASGIHIGMKQRTAQMREYIYKIRPDGLAVLNLSKIDQQIKVAAKFLSRLSKIIVVSRKPAAMDAIKKFSEVVGAVSVVGRFMPGTLTNPGYKKFFEAEVVVIADTLTDVQVLKEAVKARVPVVAVSDTFNDTREIDLVLPANNNSKRSLATLFWLLAREILKERGKISSYQEFNYKIEDFAGGQLIDEPRVPQIE